MVTRKAQGVWGVGFGRTVRQLCVVQGFMRLVRGFASCSETLNADAEALSARWPKSLRLSCGAMCWAIAVAKLAESDLASGLYMGICVSVFELTAWMGAEVGVGASRGWYGRRAMQDDVTLGKLGGFLSVCMAGHH